MVLCGAVRSDLVWFGVAWPGLARHPKSCRIDSFYENVRSFQYSMLLDIGEGEPSCPSFSEVGPSFSGFGPSFSGVGPALPSASWPFFLGFGPSEVGPALHSQALALPSRLPSQGLAFPLGFSLLALPSAGLPLPFWGLAFSRFGPSFGLLGFGPSFWVFALPYRIYFCFGVVALVLALLSQVWPSLLWVCGPSLCLLPFLGFSPSFSRVGLSFSGFGPSCSGFGASFSLVAGLALLSVGPSLCQLELS